jgi:hypothetical protein
MSEGLLMKYFVLKPKGTSLHARASRRAMRSYAALIEQENQQFADELRAWADAEFSAAVEAGMVSDADKFPEMNDRWGQ